MLRTRIITAVVLLLLILGLFALQSFAAVAAACALFFGAAAWETLRLFRHRLALPAAVALAAVFGYAALFRPAPDPLVLYGLCSLIWAIRLAPSLGVGLPAPGSVGDRLVMGVYLLTVFGSFFAILALYRHSALYLFSAMAIVWVADIGAYFAGKAFGKRKLAPSISPGKSWEGAIGGWVAVLVLAGVTVAVPALRDTFAVNLYKGLGFVLFASVMSLIVAASIVGDLFESALKRRAGFKDSSGLLPGHGGVLDRIDALIPTLPLIVLVDTWLAM